MKKVYMALITMILVILVGCASAFDNSSYKDIAYEQVECKVDCLGSYTDKTVVNGKVHTTYQYYVRLDDINGDFLIDQHIPENIFNMLTENETLIANIRYTTIYYNKTDPTNKHSMEEIYQLYRGHKLIYTNNDEQ